MNSSTALAVMQGWKFEVVEPWDSPALPPQARDALPNTIGWKASSPEGVCYGRGVSYYPSTDDPGPIRESVIRNLAYNIEETMSRLLVPKEEQCLWTYATCKFELKYRKGTKESVAGEIFDLINKRAPNLIVLRMPSVSNVLVEIPGPPPEDTPTG